MTLQQLRCLCEVVNHGLNLSRAARTLHTSQPAITKMIQALESELDVQLLVRVGPRIVSVTDEGEAVVAFAAQVLHDVRNLRAAASDSKNAERGALRLGTTHLQARYELFDAVRRFAQRYPEVDLLLSQGRPAEIADWVSAGEVDIGVSTVPEALPANVLKLEAYRIRRCIIAPAAHRLLELKKPTLAQLARHRLIAYDNQLDESSVVRRAFDTAKVQPRIVVRTSDADLVKDYVAAGLGVAVMQETAVRPTDRGLKMIRADHLFPTSTAWILVRRDQYLRRFMYDFIAQVAPHWTRAEVDRLRSGRGSMAATR